LKRVGNVESRRRHPGGAARGSVSNDTEKLTRVTTRGTVRTSGVGVTTGGTKPGNVGNGQAANGRVNDVRDGDSGGVSEGGDVGGGGSLKVGETPKFGGEAAEPGRLDCGRVHGSGRRKRMDGVRITVGGGGRSGSRGWLRVDGMRRDRRRRDLRDVAASAPLGSVRSRASHIGKIRVFTREISNGDGMNDVESID